MDNVEPKIVRVLEKVSSTIDKNEERCEETDRKDQHELEWKQVALVIGNITTTNIEKHFLTLHNFQWKTLNLRKMSKSRVRTSFCAIGDLW